MTPHQQLTVLFAPFVGSGNTIPWLAREVLDLAVRAGNLVLPGPGGPDDLAGLDRRLFRPLLAALAHAAAAETGADFDPYHGRYAVERRAEDGRAVLLLVALGNTLAEQYVQIVRCHAGHESDARPQYDPAGTHRSAIA